MDYVARANTGGEWSELAESGDVKGESLCYLIKMPMHGYLRASTMSWAEIFLTFPYFFGIFFILRVQ